VKFDENTITHVDTNGTPKNNYNPDLHSKDGINNEQEGLFLKKFGRKSMDEETESSEIDITNPSTQDHRENQEAIQLMDVNSTKTTKKRKAVTTPSVRRPLKLLHDQLTKISHTGLYDGLLPSTPNPFTSHNTSTNDKANEDTKSGIHESSKETEPGASVCGDIFT